MTTDDAKAVAGVAWLADQVPGYQPTLRHAFFAGAEWQQAQDRERIEAQAALIRQFAALLARTVSGHGPICADDKCSFESCSEARTLLARAAELEAGGTV